MKNKNTEKAANGSMGLCGVLTIIFVVLKLIGVIDWAWVWVLSPLWISFILGIIGIVIAVIAMVYIFKKEKFGWWD
jgi:membrane protein YdbS with pleckstrin-like domain